MQAPPHAKSQQNIDAPLDITAPAPTAHPAVRVVRHPAAPMAQPQMRVQHQLHFVTCQAGHLFAIPQAVE